MGREFWELSYNDIYVLCKHSCSNQLFKTYSATNIDVYDNKI